ncbi:MAG: GH25 family lysozyme [Cyanobacteria bacterium J06635_10]
MSVKIQSPESLSLESINEAVKFQGSAVDDVVYIQIFADKYLLGTVPVINQNWSVFYSFNQAGKRKITVKGFDANDKQIATHSIDILLINSDDDKPVKGIDISNNNPPINWHTVKRSGISFAFAKATEGGTWIDQTFASHWSRMKAAGIIRGAYHYCRPNKTAQQQADNFLRVVENVFEPGDLPPVLDVEQWPPKVGREWNAINLQQRINLIGDWLEKVGDALGERPIIYTSPSFWREYMNDTLAFTDYPLWLAHYTSRNQPTVPANNWGGNGYTFWQYTERGRVPGVIGDVDVNRYSGNFRKLVALANNSFTA